MAATNSTIDAARLFAAVFLMAANLRLRVVTVACRLTHARYPASYPNAENRGGNPEGARQPCATKQIPIVNWLIFWMSTSSY
jgi:hypothetical protein